MSCHISQSRTVLRPGPTPAQPSPGSVILNGCPHGPCKAWQHLYANEGGGVSIVGEAALPERCPCDRGGTVAASPLGWGLGRNPLRHSRNAVPLAWIRQL